MGFFPGVTPNLRGLIYGLGVRGLWVHVATAAATGRASSPLAIVIGLLVSYHGHVFHLALIVVPVQSPPVGSDRARDIGNGVIHE